MNKVRLGVDKHQFVCYNDLAKEKLYGEFWLGIPHKCLKLRGIYTMSVIWELATNGRNSITGDDVMNVYYYIDEVQSVGTLIAAQDLMIQFEASVGVALGQVLSLAYTVTTLRVTEYQGLVQWERPPILAINGTVAGVTAPPYVVYPVALIKSTRLTKNGAKRYCPVIKDTYDSTGVITDTDIILGMDALMVALAQHLTGGVTGFSFKPIILGKIKDKLPVIIPNIIAAATYTRTSTQNSRKVGRGS